MKMLILLIVKNVVEQCRDIKRNSLFLVLPIAIFICFYSYFQLNNVEVSFVKPIVVGVVLEDDSVFSQMLVNDFESKRDLSKFFQIAEGTLEEIQKGFDQKQYDAMVIIPNEFVTSLMSFDYLPIKINIHNNDPIKTMILYNAFLGYEGYITSVEKGVTAFYNVFRTQVEKDIYREYNDALSIDLVMTVLNRNQMYDYKPIVDIPAVVSVEYYFISLTVMFIFMLSLFSGMTLLNEQKNQAFLRLQTTKISLTSYLSSKIISHTFIILIIVFIWSIAYDLIIHDENIFMNPLLVTFLMLVIIFSVVTSLLLTLFISNEHELLLFSSVFVFLNAIVGGSIIPIHYMPESLKSIGKFTPNYSAIRVLLFLKNNIPFQHIALIIFLMSCGVILSFIVLLKGYQIKIRRGMCG